MKIKCLLDFNASRKIDAIRALRRATGLGLKEAKEMVDCGLAQLGGRYPSHVMFNPHQFGLLMASCMLDSNDPPVVVHDVEMINTQLVQDFSGLPLAA